MERQWEYLRLVLNLFRLCYLREINNDLQNMRLFENIILFPNLFSIKS